MISDPTPVLFGLRLRAVEISDAVFIIEQRLHPRAKPFLGETSSDIQAQKRWIERQREQPLDAYWVCENEAGTALGTIGIYNIEGTCGEWGRFVVRPGSKAAPGCLLLALTAAFDLMGLTEIKCTTVATNARAISFYERAGLLPNQGYKGSVMLYGEPVAKVAHDVTLATWREVRARLRAAAAMKAAEVTTES